MLQLSCQALNGIYRAISCVCVCRRSSLSQHVTELAQRVDFSEVTEGKEGEPAVKKATQKWPWEQPHSKLK